MPDDCLSAVERVIPSETFLEKLAWAKARLYLRASSTEMRELVEAARQELPTGGMRVLPNALAENFMLIRMSVSALEKRGE